MNTRIGYHYADKTNCKQYTSIIIKGTITWEQIAPYLVKEYFFIPSQIGLEDLQLRFALPGFDQPWHKIGPEDLKPTDSVPTMSLSSEEFVERFAKAKWELGLARVVKEKSQNTVVEQPLKASTPGRHVYAKDKQQESTQDTPPSRNTKREK